MSTATKQRTRGGAGGVAWLRRGDRRYRTLIENLSDIIAVLDPAGLIVYASPSTRRLLGYEQEELEGHGVLEFVPSPEADDLRIRLGDAFELGDEPGPLELQFRHKEGGWRLLEGVARRVTGEHPPLLLLTLRDVTDYRRAVRAQFETEARYQALFEGNPFPMWVYDVTTLKFLAVNDAAVEHYGYSRPEFLGMTVKGIHPPEELPRLEATQASLRSRGGDPRPWDVAFWRHRKKDGTLFEVETRSTALNLGWWRARLAMAKDLSGERRLEEQLRQAQKMEAIGRLSAGVAHDFNNVLGVISGYGELLGKKIPEGEPQLRRYVDDILKAAERGAALTHQLLAFSRQQMLQPRVVDLNSVVGEVETMLRRVLGEDIGLVTILASRTWAVKVDPGRIEQVLLNLAENARDAMPQGGCLTIETANVELDAAYARSRLGVEPGPHVMLAVTDTGRGMDRETGSHLFEPFFTTKEPGQRTGLGLATVYGIVKQSGGHIFVCSEPGHGTTFTVYLPGAPEGEDRVHAISTPARPEPSRRTETVLLVEDEVSLRTIVRECLEAGGYRVLEARQAAEAIEVAEAHPDPIHLLMTDVVMPGMSGSELAATLAASHSDLKVIYMSGCIDEAVVSHGVRAANVAFLQKPFTLDALLQKVRSTLDAGGGEALRGGGERP